MVKYEDELDLLAIVDVSHTEDEGQASVRLHHNKSGALLKKIALQEPWDVVGITQYSHSPQPQPSPAPSHPTPYPEYYLELSTFLSYRPTVMKSTSTGTRSFTLNKRGTTATAAMFTR